VSDVAIHIAAFIDAVRYCDVEKAMRAAGALKAAGHPLEPRSSLQLLVLLIRSEDPRAKEAGERWLQRLRSAGCSETEEAIARAALEGLKVEDARTAWRCEKILFLLA
jgi:hypothetical protein